MAGSYQALVNWYCSLLTRRTVYGRAAGNTIRTQNQPSENEPSNCTISVLALQDHCSYKAPTTNHHIKPVLLTCLFFRFVRYLSSRFKFIKTLTKGLKCVILYNYHHLEYRVGYCYVWQRTNNFVA